MNNTKTSLCCGNQYATQIIVFLESYLYCTRNIGVTFKNKLIISKWYDKTTTSTTATVKRDYFRAWVKTNEDVQRKPRENSKNKPLG